MNIKANKPDAVNPAMEPQATPIDGTTGHTHNPPMTQGRPGQFLRVGMAAIPLEAGIGLAAAILATQFFPRQGPREPCYVDIKYFAYAGVVLSIGLPWMHMMLARWSTPQRLTGLIMAAVAFAFLFYGLGWRGVLNSSWREGW